MIERVLQALGQLFLREHAIRRELAARTELAVRGNVLIERHLIGAMAAAPEPVTVPRLVHRDAVDPGAQARLPAKSMDGAKDAEEDFLGEVQRLVAIAQEVDGELHDHPLMLGHELGAGRLVAHGAALHQGGFTPAYFGPRCDARLLQ